MLPLLTSHCHYFQDADFASQLLEQTLHTTYRLSQCRSLTKIQRDNVSDFLISLTRSDIMRRQLLWFVSDMKTNCYCQIDA